MFRKFQMFVALNQQSVQMDSEFYDPKKFRKDHITFKCDSNCILAIRVGNMTKFGILKGHKEDKAIVILINAKFNHDLMVYEVVSTGDVQTIDKISIIPVVGHMYKYGVEPDIIDVIQFNCLVEFMR